MGGWSPKYVEIDGIRYYTALYTSSRTGSGYRHYSVSKGYIKTQVYITFVEQIGKYSMWNELMYRMSSISCTSTCDYMVGFTYTQKKNWYDTYMEDSGGYIIGGPWEAYSQDSLWASAMQHDDAGNSTYGREECMVNTTSVRNIVTGYRAIGCYHTHEGLSQTTMDRGWRPILYSRN